MCQTLADLQNACTMKATTFVGWSQAARGCWQVDHLLRETHAQQLTRARPFLDVQWEMLHHNPSILYFKHITLQIQVPPLPQAHVQTVLTITSIICMLPALTQPDWHAHALAASSLLSCSPVCHRHEP